MNFKRISKTKPFCQFSVKPTAICQLSVTLLAICQLSVYPIQTLCHDTITKCYLGILE